MRGAFTNLSVVPYIGTWIETIRVRRGSDQDRVVPYIGTWIETLDLAKGFNSELVVPYIGTWIETCLVTTTSLKARSRTLYRYVD